MRHSEDAGGREVDATRRTFLEVMASASLAAVGVPSGAGAVEAPAASPVGSRLVLADLPLIEGGTFRAASAERLVTVLYWWASWCPFCAEMSPDIEKLWRARRDAGLTVLGVSIDRTIEPAREHRQRKCYTFPSAWQGADRVGVLPQVTTVPTLWVRDRAGRVVLAEKGQLFPEDVEQIARFL